MSLLRISRAPIAARLVNGAASQTPAVRAFSASSVQALKETDRDHPNQAEHYEHHKQDQLAKQKAGINHWKPELASDSEEAIHADRQARGAAKVDMKELQDKTARSAEEKQKAGTSQSSGLD